MDERKGLIFACFFFIFFSVIVICTCYRNVEQAKTERVKAEVRRLELEKELSGLDWVDRHVRETR